MRTQRRAPASRPASRLAVVALIAGPLIITACDGRARPSPPPTAGQIARVSIDAGALAGVVQGGVSSFKGIPYAAPPVGPLRWRPPQPLSRWSGVRDASHYGDDCWENRLPGDTGTSNQPMSEDCLTLNVWTSAAPGSQPPRPGLPVMVWIHGGGLVNGSGAAPLFDGSSLARRGVVVVTFNYRLGRFGFFAHPALTREDPSALLGDYGTMDQIAVLRWVARNIRAFGGDPANVTIFGESSGGEAVNRLMLSPGARGLFQKAIAESGGGRNPWKPLKQAEAIGKAFAVKAGVPGDDAAALRAIPAATVLGAITLLNNEPDIYAGPILDGRLASENVAQGFAAGHQAKIPYLVGSNSDELGMIPGFLLGSIVDKAAAPLGPDEAAVVAAYASPAAFTRHYLTDANFSEPARVLAGATAAAGQPTFLYRFGYVAAAAGGGHGAFHASEIQFVFGNVPAATPADQAVADLLGGYWTNFAKTGDPNDGARPAWPAYAATSDLMLSVPPNGLAAASKAGAQELDAITKHFAASP